MNLHSAIYTHSSPRLLTHGLDICWVDIDVSLLCLYVPEQKLLLYYWRKPVRNMDFAVVMQGPPP